MLFKKEFSFEDRKKESDRVIITYPGKIPIICEKSINCSSIPEMNKRKFLVCNHITIGQFIYIIRGRMKIPPEKALFLFVNNIIPPTSALISKIYNEHKDPDNFLYISYTGENTFGKN